MSAFMDGAGSLEAPPGARVHGGPDASELAALGVDPDALIDFSASTNPYGPHPHMLEALRAAPLARYPDSTALWARRALCRGAGVDADRIVLGNGAAELLWSLARALLGAGRTALIVEPTFSEFRAAARATRAEVIEWRARPEQGFAIDLAAIGERARAARSHVIYLCSPNTPTGGRAPAQVIAEFARAHPELTVVLDQSFVTLSEHPEDAAYAMPANVAIVRSLTKDHGIPGVRVGYLVAELDLCRRVEQGRPQWTTSAFAQAAALASADCEDFVAESRRRLLEDRRALEAALAGLGIETLPSTTTFFLARLPNVPALRARLLQHHQILVRDCASFGLPGFLRLSAKPAKERAALMAALAAEARRC